TKGLAMAVELVLPVENTVRVYFRWTASAWHPDIHAAGAFSNYSLVVLRILDGKISEVYQQEQDFIFLLGRTASSEVYEYPQSSSQLILERDESGKYCELGESTREKCEQLGSLIDIAFGARPIAEADGLLAEQLEFFNGNVRGEGLAEWKTFAYAIRSSF